MKFLKIKRENKISFVEEAKIKGLDLEDGIFHIVTSIGGCWGDSIEIVDLNIDQLIDIANNYVKENKHLRGLKDDEIEF